MQCFEKKGGDVHEVAQRARADVLASPLPLSAKKFKQIRLQ